MSFSTSIPDEAVDSCRALAIWLQRTAAGEDETTRAKFVYRTYVRALAQSKEPLHTFEWRRFVRALDAYLSDVPDTDSHAAAHLRSIVSENSDLLPGDYGLSETDGIVSGRIGAASLLAV